MARGRKKGKSIKVLTNKDKELMFGIARTGITSYNDVISRIGLNEKRLRNLEKEGYIASKNVIIKGKESIKTYYLDNKGKKYIKMNSSIDTFYRSNERQVEHDLRLSSIYYMLGKDERETWQNENDLIETYKKNNPGKNLNTMIDATYILKDHVVAVEVVTRNYTKEQLQEKYKIADEIGCKEVLKVEA